MEKIFSLILSLVLCLSITSSTFAGISDFDYNIDGIPGSQELTERTYEIIAKTNLGWVVVENEGVIILPYNELNSEILGGTGEDYKDLYEIVCNKCGKTWNVALEPLVDVKQYVESERCPDCDSDRLNFHFIGGKNDK